MAKKPVIHHIGKLALWSAILIAVVLAIGLMKKQTIVAKYADVTKPVPPVAVIPTKEQVAAIEKLPETKLKAALPKTFNLDVPFIKQAPLGNWDAVHEETCEEASVLTVHAFYEKLKLSDNDVEAQLLKMVELEKKMFGYFEDTNVSETIQFANAQYAFSKSVVIENPSLNDLKKEIFAGRPVLFPADGKKLSNPNFRGGGPPYHLIVLRGWNEMGFFANDPGTRKGENYYYTNDIILKSNHDWVTEDHKASGPSRVFVFYP
jgi:hypothetical protein